MRTWLAISLLCFSAASARDCTSRVSSFSASSRAKRMMTSPFLTRLRSSTTSRIFSPPLIAFPEYLRLWRLRASRLPVARAGGSTTVGDWKFALMEHPRPHGVAQKQAARSRMELRTTLCASGLFGKSSAGQRS